MARLARLAIAGELHLVLQRGHNALAVFAEREDRVDYLRRLRDAAQQQQVAVHAYGFAADEVLLLATPPRNDSLGRMMQAVSRHFVRSHNQRHQRSGALWQGRFASTVVDPLVHGLASLRMVDAAGLLPRDELPDASVSSAAQHAGVTSAEAWLAAPPFYWSLGNTPFEREARFRDWLAQPLLAQERNLLRAGVVKGWVLGDASFEAALAERVDRRLRPLPRGRPRKVAPAEAT